MTLYNEMEQAIRAHQEKLFVSDDTEESDVRLAVRRVMRDNPDIFWFVHQYRFDSEGKTVSLQYQFSKERSERLRRSIADVVNNDFQIGYVRTLDTARQVMYVYKWLLSYCRYNLDSAYNQTIDSVFVRRNSVCTGYAKAAQYLFKLLGIESRLVFGRLHNDKETGRHCWNIVFVDGQPYHWDVCLGDPALEDILRAAGGMDILRFGMFNYNCFCVSSAEIGKTRSIEEEESLPVCRRSLEINEIERLSGTKVRKNVNTVGCMLTYNGSTADIYLCSEDKQVVLKKFRGGSAWQCRDEYGFMARLKGCEHILQLDERFTDIGHDIIAVEQATPIVDLFCSHYCRPTLRSVVKMMRDVTEGWLECYRRGILYRDLHVCNIYKADDGKYKLGDFGSCAPREAGRKERVGNQWFMAPETYLHGVFDERSAVYAITSVFYFILNGLKPPFLPGFSEAEAIELKLSGKGLPRPTLLRSFDPLLSEFIRARIIDIGCAYRPADRFGAVDDLLPVFDFLLDRIKDKDVDLSFASPSVDLILAPAPSVPIGRDPAHQFAYGETVEKMAATAQALPSPLPSPDAVEEDCKTMDVCYSVRYEEPAHTGSKADTFAPKPSFWSRLFNKGKGDVVYSSVFAPAEVKRRSNMLVQVYLHRFEETEKVKELAQESQKDAKRRDYIPLQCRLKQGDKVDVRMNIYGETLLMSEQKSVIWQGAFTKCSFTCFVPGNCDIDELTCMALLSVNGIPVGEMSFVTAIVDSPRSLNSEIMAHRYKKVFISYAHKDEATVKPFHEGLELAGVEHFFDRHNLKAGDVFPQVIQDYIESADLFVLFWSENASLSEYVLKERTMALKRAFPMVRPAKDARLSIYPMSIEPHAELPDDMKDYYHFGQL